MRQSILSFFVLLIVFLAAAGAEQPNTFQELKPWQGAKGTQVNPALTTEYMNSRPPRQVQTINHNWTSNYFPSEQHQVRVRHSENPILKLGPLGAFDSYNIHAPHVV